MKFKEMYLKGCFVITPQVLRDERGFFMESFNQKKFFQEIGFKPNFVQDNLSKSSKGVLRGLHFQRGKAAQAKLVQVLKGRVLDVCVDLRPKSKTFGEYYAIELSEENKLQMFIPRGFAHGFLTIEDNTIFSYKCDNFYNKESESGIIYNDLNLGIEWKHLDVDYKISEKDLQLPKLKDLVL